MASLADRLREECGSKLIQDLPWLPACVERDIRAQGRYFLICDYHIRDISTDFSVPMKYDNAIREWARENGFNVFTKPNGYGVKQICITL